MVSVPYVKHTTRITYDTKIMILCDEKSSVLGEEQAPEEPWGPDLLVMSNP